MRYLLELYSREFDQSLNVWLVEVWAVATAQFAVLALDTVEHKALLEAHSSTKDRLADRT